MAENTNTEREAFESALKSLAAKHGETLEARDFGRESSGEYENGATEIAWMLWQARASLSPPAAGQEPVAQLWVSRFETDVKVLPAANDVRPYGGHMLYLGAAPQPAVAAGWVMVPITPTNQMTTEGANALEDPENERSSWDLAENMYRAMLDALPTAPSTEGESNG